MTSLTTTHGSSAQAQLLNKVNLGEGATESREIGAIKPQKEEAPKAKPLAHFVAGGYVAAYIVPTTSNFANSSVQNRWNDRCHIDESSRRP